VPTDAIGSRARIVNQVLTQCEWVNARILAVASFVESICAGKYTTATDFERTDHAQRRRNASQVLVAARGEERTSAGSMRQWLRVRLMRRTLA
jgi:hypothetical protein